MTVTIGSRIGTYEITGVLGAGGMGEVYRARDTRLGREVAIKFLPELFALDPDRRARFEREARALAALNHPNIAQIYGVEERALVMELVDGATLDQRIAQGGLPVDEVIRIARQMADALQCAHEHGIVHRDLKPANVTLRDDGTVKILDFGLAKAADPVGSDVGGGAAAPVNSPTFTSVGATERGLILGTAAYMSPEQARGKPVDARADIWAFGVVVFEMLIGRQLFAGETVSDTLAAVLRQDIPWSALPPIPLPLRRLLERCLQKDPARRLHSMADARFDLDESTVAPVAAQAPGGGMIRARRRWLPWSVATVALAAAVVAWALGRGARAQQARWQQFTQVTDTEGEEIEPSISPDGRSIAFSSRARGTWDIYVQRIGGRNPILVAGDPDVDETSPAFSPDGQTIAYDVTKNNGGIFVAGATGESSRRLTDFGFDPAWSPDGRRIVFSTEHITKPTVRLSIATLWIVDVGGGQPRKIQDGDGVEPSWSPSGTRIAFWAIHGGQRDLYTIPAGGGPPVALTHDAPLDWSPAWSPDGRFVYFASDRGGTMNIWRIVVDEGSGRPLAAPEPVTAGVQSALQRPSLSADGSRLAFEARTESTNPVALPFDPATGHPGVPVVLGNRTGFLMPTDVSRDGRQMVLQNNGERQEDIFVAAVDGSGLRRLTDDPARDRFPLYAADGRIVFFSNRGNHYETWSIAPDGGDLRRVASMENEDMIWPLLSPGGDRMVVSINGTPLRAFTARLTHTPNVNWEPLKGSIVNGRSFVPRDWSPDGRRLAGYISTGSANSAGVAVYDVPTGSWRQLTSDPALIARWLRDSRHLVYFDVARNRLVFLDADSGQRVDSPIASTLFASAAGLAVAPDGRTIYYGGTRAEANIWMVEQK